VEAADPFVKTNNTTTLFLEKVIRATRLPALLLIFSLPALVVHADFNGTDYFPTGSAKWDAVTAGGTSKLTVTNGRYEYTHTGASSGNDFVWRRWNVNQGSYTNDWSVQVDVHLNAFSMSSDNQYINLNLGIQDNSNPDLSYAVAIDRYWNGANVMDFYSGLGDISTEIANTTTDAALRISFDSLAKTLTAWYDADGAANGYTWIPLETVSIASGDNNWGMTTSSQFNACLIGGSGYITATSGQAYFDNFLATGLVCNPQVKTNDACFGVRTNCFGFTITGVSDQVVAVDACTNLSNPVWLTIQTNTLIGGSSYFADPYWTNHPGRFYRLRSP
jgi:hypothetical protein